MLSKIIKGAINGAINALNTPDSHIIGKDFETFTENYFLSSPLYTLISRTSSFDDNRNNYALDTLNPDLKFKDKLNNQFYIECKFRSHIQNDTVIICTDQQLKRYTDISKQIPVFIALGVYGKPTNPDYFHIIPITKLKYPNAKTDYLQRFLLFTDKIIHPSQLWALYNNTKAK